MIRTREISSFYFLFFADTLHFFVFSVAFLISCKARNKKPTRLSGFCFGWFCLFFDKFVGDEKVLAGGHDAVELHCIAVACANNLDASSCH